MEIIDNTKQEIEKIYIIQPILRTDYKALAAEAESLIESAGALCAGVSFIEVREINPATFIGSGNLEKLCVRLSGLPVTVLFNGDLSPSQTLNISAALDGRKVIDRTTLILDIFARNAKTSEGKLQVELAQLKYLYPRLKGKGQALSRLGGGIGTRGPGETKLETDRRRIRARIVALENRLSDLKQRRQLVQERREKQALRTISLIGYTNTGKSTLLNLLTEAGVYAEDRLFATLDTTTRKLIVDGSEFLLTDTVGFLRELPHSLISAFHSTLESALQCDLALIVCDARGDHEMQLAETLETLRELGGEVPYLIVMNKSEELTSFDGYPKESIFISAKYGIGIEALKNAILRFFGSGWAEVLLRVPYARMAAYSPLKKYADELQFNYLEDAVLIKARIRKTQLHRFQPFMEQR
mgnify:FL=1